MTVSKTTTQEKAANNLLRRINHFTADSIETKDLPMLVGMLCDFADSLTAELQKEKAEIAKALGIHFCPELEEPWEVPMEPDPDYFETLSKAAAFVYAVLDKGLSDREKENAWLMGALEEISRRDPCGDSNGVDGGCKFWPICIGCVARAALLKEKE